MIKNKAVAYIKKDESSDTERSIICYASTNSCDRHGEMIIPTAWTEKGLENYRKNPVILLNHDYHSLPIGKSLWQKKDENGLKFKIQFADTDLGRELYYLYNNSYMNSFSVGFRPVKVYDNESKPKYKDNNGNVPHTVYEECELLELSSVTVPANADANMIRNFKSFVDSYSDNGSKSQELKDFIEIVKQSPEYIELLSAQPDQPEDKAKVIGFINLSEKSLDEEVTEEKVIFKLEGELSVEETEKLESLVSKINAGLEEEQKTEEKELVKAAQIGFSNIKDYMNEDGTFKWSKEEDIPEDLKAAIKEINEDSAGNIVEIILHEKEESLDMLVDNLDLFENQDAEPAEGIEKSETVDEVVDIDGVTDEIVERNRAKGASDILENFKSRTEGSVEAVDSFSLTESATPDEENKSLGDLYVKILPDMSGMEDFKKEIYNHINESIEEILKNKLKFLDDYADK